MKLKNRKPAFTLIEMIFSLFVTLILLSMVTVFMQYVHHIETKIYHERQQQWETFLIFLEKNTQNCRKVKIDGSVFSCEILDLNGQSEVKTVALKKGNADWIILSINGGTMIILDKVKRLDYEVTENTLKVQATFTDGEIYSDRIKLSRIS